MTNHSSPAQHPWGAFKQKADAALRASQPADSWKKHISLMLEPSFFNHELLRLQWDKEKIHWFRSIWLKDEDAPKFLHPIESLKYIGKTINPTIRILSGEFNASDTEPLLALIRNLSVKPYIDSDRRIVLDGCQHTLTIGTDNISSSYHWNHLPQEFTELDRVVELLTELIGRDENWGT